jgi:hypothetical protein
LARNNTNAYSPGRRWLCDVGTISCAGSSEETVMKRLRTSTGVALPLALGFAFLLGGFEISHAACQLQSPGGQIKHVVHIVFDNVHL